MAAIIHSINGPLIHRIHIPAKKIYILTKRHWLMLANWFVARPMKFSCCSELRCLGPVYVNHTTSSWTFSCRIEITQSISISALITPPLANQPTFPTSSIRNIFYLVPFKGISNSFSIFFRVHSHRTSTRILNLQITASKLVIII